MYVVKEHLAIMVRNCGTLCLRAIPLIMVWWGWEALFQSAHESSNKIIFLLYKIFHFPHDPCLKNKSASHPPYTVINGIALTLSNSLAILNLQEISKVLK
jgi:hypothetical protein